MRYSDLSMLQTRDLFLNQQVRAGEGGPQLQPLNRFGHGKIGRRRTKTIGKGNSRLKIVPKKSK